MLLRRIMDCDDESSRSLFTPREYARQSHYNEKGLAVHELTFQNSSNFGEERKKNANQIAPFEFVLWALTHCASVDDLIAKLPTIELMTSTNSATSFRKRPTGLHFIFIDSSGRLILIEPTQMLMSVIDNPLNVTSSHVDFRKEVIRLK